jgi:hypothetical protein
MTLAARQYRCAGEQEDSQMFYKLKATLGLALLAALATSAIGVMSASATTSGHITSEVTSTKLDFTAATGTTHQMKIIDSQMGSIECHNQPFTASVIPSTVQEITVTTTYSGCTTADGTPLEAHMNGCHYIFTSRTAPGHGTVHFRCPPGKTMIFTQGPTCTFTFGEQTPAGGIVYETITGANGKHAITANVTVSNLTATRHGTCQIFGTNGATNKWSGSMTIEGTNASTGAPVGITAT